jgi:2-(1,2-epoxy-1,2-dihydrophenyl)acetyl-CoA isomerase
LTATTEDVLHHHIDGVDWITLNRPDAANALTPSGRDTIIDLLERTSADARVRAVVLAANGRHFCSGADLSAPSGRTAGQTDGGPQPSGPGTIARTLRLGSQRLVAAILDCEKPVIAELHGAAAGIGAHLILACDFVVADENSRIIEVFARRALVPDGGGAYLLPRLVGPTKAKQMMMLADDVSAQEALSLGLVYSVVSADDLRAATTTLAARLASAPTRALAMTKWLVNRSLESSRDQAFADEGLAQELNMSTDDAQEGLQSFVERRPASYLGR